MNAILLVKQMDLVACLTMDFFAFLSISVHSKCDFALYIVSVTMHSLLHCLWEGGTRYAWHSD